MLRLFVPGFAARPAFYRDALGDDWVIHRPPPMRCAPTFEERIAAVCAEVDAAGRRVVLGGHSLGAALAACVAARRPEQVERLLLVSPAGLPLVKPVRASLGAFALQTVRGVYPAGELSRALLDVARAPLATARLARAVRSLDLRATFRAVAASEIRCDVVGCAGDTLTTVAHARGIAELAGGRYVELDAAGGHVWMLVEPSAFAAVG